MDSICVRRHYTSLNVSVYDQSPGCCFPQNIVGGGRRGKMHMARVAGAREDVASVCSASIF
jgi:hypothetical protein